MRIRPTASKALNKKFGLVVVVLILLFTGIFILKSPLVSQATVTAPAQEKREIMAGQEVAANRVIVKYRSTKSRASLQSIAQTLDVDVDVELGGTGARLLHSNS
jgi:hypothetical protein